MLNNFSDIFNRQIPQPQRKYQHQPQLFTKPNVIQRKKFNQNKRNISVFEGILDFLPIPIQNWALVYEKSFYTFALHEWMYNQIVSFSTSFNYHKKQQQQQRNIIKQQISDAQQQQSLVTTTTSFNPICPKPSISLHNIFVLMTQYKLMHQIISNLNTQELQMMIDGLSYIYFCGVGNKVENIGEVVVEQNVSARVSSNNNSWGTIDELTCCIHYLTTHTRVYKIPHQNNQTYSLTKYLTITKMPTFLLIYSHLYRNKKIDNIVNSIPMFMQLLQIVGKHNNNNKNNQNNNQSNSKAGCQFVAQLNWLSALGQKIMEIISYNVNKLLVINNSSEFGEEFSLQEMEIISQLQNVNQQNQKQESQIVLKLTQKAMLLKQTQKHINSRILFSYAYYHLYTVHFMLKLTKKVLELSKCHYQVYKVTCQNVCLFLLKLFDCANKFDFLLPENSLTQICEMIKILSDEGEYLFGEEEHYVRGYDCLYGREINSVGVKQFMKVLQKSQRFGCYYNNNPHPLTSSTNNTLNQQQQPPQSYKVSLQPNQQSTLYHILNSIYTTAKLDHLSIIHTMLKHADKRYLQRLQFYLIKNQLLHFLLQNQHQVQLKDKRNLKMLYDTVACLIKGNYVAYAIVDEVVVGCADDEEKYISGRIEFVEDLKKNFPQTRNLLLVMLADNITMNYKFQKDYYCPIVLSKLLYPSQSQEESVTCLLPQSLASSPKHQIWISYIFNVILHELFTVRKRYEEIENKRKKTTDRYENLFEDLILMGGQLHSRQHYFETEIYEWTTLILLLHIDYTQQQQRQQSSSSSLDNNIYQQQNDQLILAQFVMTYLTTILSQAIKWKSKNQSTKMIEFMKVLQQWQNHYTDLILNQENNEDLIEQQYGGIIKFLFLKRWNKKIVKAIILYLDSMEDYRKEQRVKRNNSLEKKVRNTSSSLKKKYKFL